MNANRKATRISIAGGAIAAAALGFAPMAASAASNPDTLTVAGGSAYTYTFNQSPSIKAVANPNCLRVGSSPVTISISGPGVIDSTLVSHARDCSGPLTVSPSASSVNTAHPAWSGGAPAMNGVYSVTLDNEGRTQSASFTLLIPPAKTRGFAVNASGSQATFNWIANSEPDVTGYDITDSSGHSVATATDSCAGSSCTTGPVDLGSAVIGHTESYSIVADRSCGAASCSGGHLVSSSPATASATFTAPPKPKPTSSPTSSPSGSPSPGTGNGTGTGTGGGSGSGAGGGNGGSVGLGGSKGHKHHNGSLPSASGGVLPALGAPALPGVETSTRPLNLGKPGGKIAYPAPEVAKKSAVHTISHDLSAGLSLSPLLRGIAAAAILLLIAVHLRSWAGRETY